MFDWKRVYAHLLATNVLVILFFLVTTLGMFLYRYAAPVLVSSLFASAQSLVATGGNFSVEVAWFAPNKTWINDLERVTGDKGTNGFVFSGSQLPQDVDYGTYNWCNMPHVRKEEYPVASEVFELQYVEVIHRHHKRTPYADNTFYTESYGWSCSDEGLFYYGQPLNPESDPASSTYWNISKSSINPFAQRGFNGSCQFPQITRGGLEDSWQHGKDLWGVYGELLNFLPKDVSSNTIPSDRVTFRVTGNVITSQVAGMVSQGLLSTTPSSPYPLLQAPDGTDSLEPAYSCPASSAAYSAYGIGSTNTNWTAHLSASASLFAALDSISGIPPDDAGWHGSWDHYYDNLSARQCHSKPLPCSISDTSKCVSQAQADAVYRLGQYEYSYLYRDAPQSLAAATPSFGLWLAELALHVRENIRGASGVVYRHNVAHDGSLSRLLSILQVDVMVWPGMGSEVVFEVYKKRQGKEGKRFLRILWGGQVLRSSHPQLGLVDMIDVEVFLAYVDALAGHEASKIVALCTA